MKISVPEQVEFILKQLREGDFESYIVGGCVRDSLLGKEPNDWDICTSATPTEILNTFRDSESMDVGIKYGTVTILLNGEGYEITTFRKDSGYTDGRHPDNVEFTQDIAEDLKRRDLTINAMAYNEETGIIDLFGGQEDLKHRVLRCVGSPELRFEEDALRILRAVRFAVVYGLDIDEGTFKEMLAHKEKLGEVSLERITAEFEKMFNSGMPIRKVFTQCSEIICKVIPELERCVGFAQNNKHHNHEVYEHMLYVTDGCNTKDFSIKMAAFLHDIGKPDTYTEDTNGWGHFYGHPELSYSISQGIMDNRLRLRNEQRNEILTLIKYHDMMVAKTKKSVKRALNKLGEPLFRKWIILKTSDKLDHIGIPAEHIHEEMKAIESLLDEIISAQECFSIKDLAINGRDLISIGYKTGVVLGETLEYLLETVLEGGENTRENLMRLALERLGKVGAINV